MEPVKFTAIVARVQTMADGGLRFTFDAPESEVMQAAELMTCKRFGVVLQVMCEERKSLTELDDETEKDAEGSGDPVDCRRVTIRRDK